MGESKPELELDSVTKQFGVVRAVDQVSLQLHPGEFLSLVGPSGCGKTTTLRMIAGFMIPDGGRVLMRGREITYNAPYRRDVGLLFQSYALFPHMTVSENIGFGPKMRGATRRAVQDKVRWALDLVRLSGFEDRRPQQLSGGQQQRVAVARVLAAGASVLLLDEPFSNLDAKLRKLMQDDLRELQQRLGIATIHVTHDQEEAMSMSDRLVVMNSGRIEQQGTPEDVYRMPRSEFVADFMGRCNKLDGQLSGYGAGDGMVEFDLDNGERLTLPWCDAIIPSRGSVFVRPEHITAASAGSLPNRANVLSGELRRVVYLGPATTLYVALRGGHEMIVQVPDSAERPNAFRVGVELDLFVPPACLAPLPS